MTKPFKRHRSYSDNARLTILITNFMLISKGALLALVTYRRQILVAIFTGKSTLFDAVFSRSYLMIIKTAGIIIVFLFLMRTKIS